MLRQPGACMCRARQTGLPHDAGLCQGLTGRSRQWLFHSERSEESPVFAIVPLMRSLVVEHVRGLIPGLRMANTYSERELRIALPVSRSTKSSTRHGVIRRSVTALFQKMYLTKALRLPHLEVRKAGLNASRETQKWLNCKLKTCGTPPLSSK